MCLTRYRRRPPERPSGRDTGAPLIVQHENAGVQNRTLVQCGADGPVQAVFEVQIAAPLHDVGEQIAEKR